MKGTRATNGGSACIARENPRRTIANSHGSVCSALGPAGGNITLHLGGAELRSLQSADRNSEVPFGSPRHILQTSLLREFVIFDHQVEKLGHCDASRGETLKAIGCDLSQTLMEKPFGFHSVSGFATFLGTGSIYRRGNVWWIQYYRNGKRYYHVGVRIGELRKVEWSQMDLNAGEIPPGEKSRRKGKKPRTIPIYGDMRPWLEMQKAERDRKWPDCRWVFHYLSKPIGSHLKGFVDACEAAGVPALRFHDLRRSAIRNMERAGMPRKLAMEISGHRTESVYRRYDIVSAQDMKLAAARMENYFEALNRAPITTVLTTVEEKPN